MISIIIYGFLALLFFALILIIKEKISNGIKFVKKEPVITIVAIGTFWFIITDFRVGVLLLILNSCLFVVWLMFSSYMKMKNAIETAYKTNGILKESEISDFIKVPYDESFRQIKKQYNEENAKNIIKKNVKKSIVFEIGEFYFYPKRIREIINQCITDSPILSFGRLNSVLSLHENFNIKKLVDDFYPAFIRNEDVIISNDTFFLKSEVSKRITAFSKNKETFNENDLKHCLNLKYKEINYGLAYDLKELSEEFDFSFLRLPDGSGIFVKDEAVEYSSCAYCHCFVNSKIYKGGEIYCCSECAEAAQILKPYLTNNEKQYSASKSDIDFDVIEFAEIGIVNEKITQFLDSEKMFHTPRGHGFAAEEGNTLLDNLQGKKAKVIGYDNTKNGADRLVHRTLIQSKYCKTGKACIDACFDDADQYRYITNNGKLIKIEVPHDKEIYIEARKAMEERIREGRIPGVEDPKMAGKIVQRGNLKYQQVKNITQFGTVESLSFDMTKGIMIGKDVGSLSFVFSFANAVWNGKNLSEALEKGLSDGAKTWGKTTIVTTASSQMIKTEIGREINLLAAKGLNIAGLSKFFQSTSPLVMIMQVSIMTFNDLCKFLDGKLSGGELLKITTKNLAVVAGGAAGGALGLMAGRAIGSKAASFAAAAVGNKVGAAVGCAIPLIGPIVGMAIGGLIADSLFGDSAEDRRQRLSQEREQKRRIDELNKHVNKMYKVFREQFSVLAEQYMLTENEAQEVLEILNQSNLTARLIEMYEMENRVSYAVRTIKPCIISVISKRKYISLLEPLAV